MSVLSSLKDVQYMAVFYGIRFEHAEMVILSFKRKILPGYNFNYHIANLTGSTTLYWVSYRCSSNPLPRTIVWSHPDSHSPHAPSRSRCTDLYLVKVR